jgi:hypothetical protein
MTDAKSSGTMNTCKRCGGTLSAGQSKCPSCGAGGTNPVTIIIIIAVVCLVGLGSISLIGIVAAIALPNFIGAQNKAKEASVKANMRTAQIAAETYAVAHDGLYPTSVDKSFKAYFPGGNAEKNLEGRPPVNPFTGEPEWPVAGDITDVEAARKAEPSTLRAGAVEYSVIMDEQQQPVAYAIRGGAKGDTAIAGTSGSATLVLSNK